MAAGSSVMMKVFSPFRSVMSHLLIYMHAPSVLGRWNHLKDEWSFLAAARAAMGVAIGIVG